MTVSIVNHKGGTGKTTTTINLGSALAAMGHSVLLVDFDAQGSLTYSLGIGDSEPTIADLLHGERSAEEVLCEREGMHVIPAGASLADVELAIAMAEDRFHHLKELLTSLPTYDFVLIDCPPSLSLLTLNALTASDKVIIPMQMDVLSLRGLESIMETIKKADMLNPSLDIMGILPVMIDPRKNIYQEILDHIRSRYTVKLFKQFIRTSVKAAEAPSFGQSVVTYAPASTTASDFKVLAKEVSKLNF